MKTELGIVKLDNFNRDIKLLVGNTKQAEKIW